MPTDEQRALWAAIRAHPADDTPRLVYADWLQERGDEPRADFIRTQCEIERLSGDPRAVRKLVPGLKHRAYVLETAHRARWLEPLFRVLVRRGPNVTLAAWVPGVRFRRGFVYGLPLDIDGVHRLMTAEGDTEPVLGVFVTQGWHGSNAKKLQAVFGWPGIGCAERISLAGATDNDIAAITTGTAARPERVWLRGCGLGDAAAEHLAGWPCARFVRALDLGLNLIGDRGAEALAASPHLEGVRELNLEGNPFGPHARQKLVARYGGNVVLTPLA